MKNPLTCSSCCGLAAMPQRGLGYTTRMITLGHRHHVMIIRVAYYSVVVTRDIMSRRKVLLFIPRPLGIISRRPCPRVRPRSVRDRGFQ